MTTIVNAWNEWDPLKHVIVGRADGGMIPAPEPAAVLGPLDSTLKCNRATKEYLKGRLEVKAFTWSFI